MEKILKTYKMPEGYEIRRILVDGKDFGSEDFEIEQAFNENGEYIGSPETAQRLYAHGIKPELSPDQTSVCSIGFCEKEQKWYSWSHRAICGFGIGDKVTIENAGYKPANKEDFARSQLQFWSDEKSHENTKVDEGTDADGNFGVWVTFKYNDTIPNKSLHGQTVGHFTPYPTVWGRGEWTAETLEDAKQMAIDFADNVG